MAPKAGEFLWGAASAAYQIEGGWDKDGRGLSKGDIYTNQWHITVPQIGKNHTGNVAINAYDRDQYLKDIALLKELGVNAYRFSISWPRVRPAGIGAVNRPGLDYYSRLVDDLIAAGIKPVVTLYHWDFPGFCTRRAASTIATSSAGSPNTPPPSSRRWATASTPSSP